MIGRTGEVQHAEDEARRPAREREPAERAPAAELDEGKERQAVGQRAGVLGERGEDDSAGERGREQERGYERVGRQRRRDERGGDAHAREGRQAGEEDGRRRKAVSERVGERGWGFGRHVSSTAGRLARRSAAARRVRPLTSARGARAGGSNKGGHAHVKQGAVRGPGEKQEENRMALVVQDSEEKGQG